MGQAHEVGTSGLFSCPLLTRCSHLLLSFLKSGASQKMISLVIHIICYSLCLILCMQNILEKYQVFPCQIVL